MRKLVVVGNPKAWSLDVPDVEVLSARRYLTSPDLVGRRRVRVFNLASDYGYLSKGYYVSLLAEARGHAVIPSVKTIQDLKEPPITRIVLEELDTLVQRSLGRLKADEFVLSIYFGENMARQHQRLAQELYRLFQAPLLRARFVRQRKRWSLQGIRPIAMKEVPENHLSFLQEAARRYFGRKRHHRTPEDRFAYDLAILVNPEERAPPSDERALQRFEGAAEKLGFSVERIQRGDYPRIGEFDALLIRETTAVSHHTYRFARRAESEGMAVIDDPDSILRCTNKVFLAELLQGAGVPVPRTLVAHSENRDQVEAELGLPVVLKIPDSSFSQGVLRADTSEELRQRLDELLGRSELVIAQAWTPTDFDWRIGVLEGQALYACKYHMARGHWQIYNWRARTLREAEGGWETLPLDAPPEGVVSVALRAAGLVGNGLYGVDVKEVAGRALVVEVNDNPTLDHGVEDEVLGEELYLRIVRTLKRQVEEKLERARGG